MRLTVKKEQSGPGLLSSTWQKSVTSRNLKCRKCSMETTFGDRRGLYIHYALRHYKEEILDKIGGESLIELSPQKFSHSSIQCPEIGCTVKKRQINDIIAHVAIDHNYVEDFLPKHWHVASEPREDFINKDDTMKNNSATDKNDGDILKVAEDEDKTFNKTDEPASSDTEDSINSKSKDGTSADHNKSKSITEEETKRRHRSLGSADVDVDTQLPVKNSVNVKRSKWQCHFCPAPRFKNKNSLHYHYAGVHFKESG